MVTSMCAVGLTRNQVLVSAGADGKMVLWDLYAGRRRTLLDLQDEVNGMCAVELTDRQLIASACASY